MHICTAQNTYAFRITLHMHACSTGVLCSLQKLSGSGGGCSAASQESATTPSVHRATKHGAPPGGPPRMLAHCGSGPAHSLAAGLRLRPPRSQQGAVWRPRRGDVDCVEAPEDRRDGQGVQPRCVQGSLSEFFRKIDADPEWFPGKHCGRKRGPQRLLKKKKRACIAESSMRQKAEGHEPSIEVTVARCPGAATKSMPMSS